MTDNTKYIRPRVNPERSLFEKVFEVLSLIFLAYSLAAPIFIIITYTTSIPSHFAFSGFPDSTADKSFICVYFSLAVLGYILFCIIEKRPWLLRYSTEITEENAEAVYKTRRSMDVVLKTEAMALISYYVLGTDLISRGIITSMLPYFQFIAIAVIAVTVLVFVMRLDKVVKQFEAETADETDN